MWIHRKKKTSHFLRKTPELRPALQSNKSFLCSLHCSRDRGEGPNGQVVCVKKTANGRRPGPRKIENVSEKIYAVAKKML